MDDLDVEREERVLYLALAGVGAATVVAALIHGGILDTGPTFGLVFIVMSVIGLRKIRARTPLPRARSVRRINVVRLRRGRRPRARTAAALHADASQPR